MAIGSERYVPYAARRQPQELLTQANAILGQGQMSLAKYLLIVADEDDPLSTSTTSRHFFRHVLERVDWRRDLHFQTCTTIDTLDYSGTGLNEGSKLVIAAVGPASATCRAAVPGDLRLADGFADRASCLPGVLAIRGPRHSGARRDGAVESFAGGANSADSINRFPLVVVVDDSEFTARTLNNFLWVTFTRSNPAADVHGIGAFVEDKHWGCQGSLVIDARAKPHHAPPLVEDPQASRCVDRLGAAGGPLHGII